jgi:hypothetical protein
VSIIRSAHSHLFVCKAVQIALVNIALHKYSEKMPVLYKLCMDCATCSYVLSDDQSEGSSFGVVGGHKPGLANWHSGEILPLHSESLEIV